MKNQILKTLFILGSITSLAQCGSSNGLSQKVTLNMIPENPVVVKADLSRANSDDVIKGPWFLMGSQIYNGSTNKLYVVNFDLEGSTISSGGQTTFQVSLDPTEVCDLRKYLAILDPGETYERINGYCDPSDVASGTNATGRYEQWYYSALPESDNSIYFMEVRANGWFVDSDDVPVERLTLGGYVITQ